MMSTVRLAPAPAVRNRQGGAPLVGLYARVSTSDQTPENQLAALRTFAIARGWDVREYIDHGISGAKERRPALDNMTVRRPRPEDRRRRLYEAGPSRPLDTPSRDAREGAAGARHRPRGARSGD
jgi:hypothetical protein